MGLTPTECHHPGAVTPGGAPCQERSFRPAWKCLYLTHRAFSCSGELTLGCGQGFEFCSFRVGECGAQVGELEAQGRHGVAGSSRAEVGLEGRDESGRQAVGQAVDQLDHPVDQGGSFGHHGQLGQGHDHGVVRDLVRPDPHRRAAVPAKGGGGPAENTFGARGDHLGRAGDQRAVGDPADLDHAAAQTVVGDGEDRPRREPAPG
ncbi:hypothetical protein [Actinoplanes sp. NPDC048796]|uniref:hypothetical protein n=1 Tax=Actinoplanes sp. NPDC048796 TaxID=3155640 RepID=UPI0033E5BB2B